MNHHDWSKERIRQLKDQRPWEEIVTEAVRNGSYAIMGGPSENPVVIQGDQQLTAFFPGDGRVELYNNPHPSVSDLTPEQMLIVRSAIIMRQLQERGLRKGWRPDVLDDLEAYIAEQGWKITPHVEEPDAAAQTPSVPGS